jgi:hypothetical protein
VSRTTAVSLPDAELARADEFEAQFSYEPVLIPWYAFKTRGRSGWRLAAGLFGLIAAPYLTAIVVGFIVSGSR